MWALLLVGWCFVTAGASGTDVCYTVCGRVLEVVNVYWVLVGELIAILVQNWASIGCEQGKES